MPTCAAPGETGSISSGWVNKDSGEFYNLAVEGFMAADAFNVDSVFAGNEVRRRCQGSDHARLHQRGRTSDDDFSRQESGNLSRTQVSFGLS